MERKLSVTLNNACLVKPAGPTFHGRLPLSLFDQIGYLGHVPIIYFYKPLPHWFFPKDTLTNTLKRSLGMALVEFYPLAGRVVQLDGGRMELDCNATGVQFIEAECEETLDELSDFSPSPLFRDLFPSMDYKNTPVEDLPLVAVQVTKFHCATIALAISISHIIADGQSALHFTSEWARLATGKTLLIKPSFDWGLLGGEKRNNALTTITPKFEHYNPLPRLAGQTSVEAEMEKKTSIELLKLTKQQIETLKRIASEGNILGPKGLYTTFEVVTAHIWRCACRARLLIHEQPTALTFPVNFRNLIRPPLPKGYIGNAVTDVRVMDFSGKLLTSPLGYAAKKIRDAISTVTNELLHSRIEFLRLEKDLSRFQLLPHKMQFDGNPNLTVISWLTLSYYHLDFGWGKPLAVSEGSQGIHDGDGEFIIRPAHDQGSGLVVTVCFQDEYIRAFKNYFYDIMGSCKL